MSARRWVLPVLVALMLWPTAVNGQSPELTDAVNRFGDLFNQGRYEEALPFAEEAIRLSEREFGREHPNTAAYLWNLAALYASQAKYVEAEALYQRAFAILEKALGPEHPEVATSLDYLALVYRAQGKQAEATEMVARAKAIRAKHAATPEPSPELMESYERYQELYAQGRYQEALPFAEEVVRLAEHDFGSGHTYVASSLSQLANLYRLQSRYAEAKPLYQRSLAIREEALGPDHPGVAVGLNDLALLYAAQGKYGEAKALYQRALEINEEALGPWHLEVATNLNNLAELYRDHGEFAEAEPLHERALAIREKALEPDDPILAVSLNNLAALYKDQGRYAEAEPLYQRSLAIWEKILGPEHPDVAISLENLAVLYKAQGRYDQAETLYKRALAIREKALGPDHPKVARTLDNLVSLYRARGQAIGPIEEVHRGVRLIALPRPPGVKYDISIVRQHEGLANARRALDVIYRESPFSADTLEILKKNGEVIIVYDPSFPWMEYTTLTYAGFLPEVPDFLLSAFPDVFIEISGGKGEKIFFVVLGRYVVKFPPSEVGGIIVHELVGHGIQHLHGHLDVVRELDLECEAWLYELNAYQDFQMDKFSPEMIQFRQELEGYNCDDFKRTCENTSPR